MMKDISSAAAGFGARVAEAEAEAGRGLPPGPAGAGREAVRREFASVIEQAMGRKRGGERGSGGVRERGEGVGERGSGGVRERGREGVRERGVERGEGVGERGSEGVGGRNGDAFEASTSSHRRPVETVQADVEEELDAVEMSASALEPMGEGGASGAASGGASDAGEGLDELDQEGEEVRSEAASNIVAFPGMALAQSVIIPFPLAAAKAMAPVTEEGVSELGIGSHGSAALGESEGISSVVVGGRNLDLAEVPDGKILQLPIGDAAKAAIAVGSEQTETGGVDFEKLGLELVEQSEVEIDLPAAFLEKVSQLRSAEFRMQNGTSEVEPQLPDGAGASEESAHQDEPSLAAIEGDLWPDETTKAPVHTGFASARNSTTSAAASAAVVAGTGAARQESRMESLSNSERANAPVEGAAHALEEFQPVASEPLPDEGAVSDLSARNLVATDWQAGRPVSSVDRSVPVSSSDLPVDAAAMVERISKLMMTETALVRKHGSDAMAVVLRPDAETELFVHFTQRNGQVEATIRCERGDAQHLSALWPQLQESLSQQRVRLAPLQEAPSNQSNFNQSTGSDQRGGENGSQRQSSRDKQFMDEWPAPASSEPGARGARGDGGSRHRRVTTSRPGWETWA